MKLKVFVVGPAKGYASFLNVDYELVNDINDCDFAIFTGGTDVDSIKYGEERIPESESPDFVRDQYETEMFWSLRAHGIPMLGICRGSQFLTVMNGGKLVQHINGHGGGHNIVDLKTKKIYTDTSGHHQMMYPFHLNNEDYKIIAYASPDRSDVYLGLSCIHLDFKERNLREPEIVYYPRSRCLCIQGHPEWGYPTPYSNYCNELILEYLILGQEKIEEYINKHINVLGHEQIEEYINEFVEANAL